MLEITKEEWAVWKENPVTRRFFQMIADRREEAIQHLAYGHNSGSMSKQNIVVGAINAYTHILGTRFEED